MGTLPRHTTPGVERTRRHRRRRYFLATTVLAVVLPGSAVAAPAPEPQQAYIPPFNLLVNQGFERPSTWQQGAFTEYATGTKAVPGWAVTTGSVDVVGQNYWLPEQGHQSLDLAGTTSGAVSQRVHTTRGRTYSLSWYMAANPTCGQSLKILKVFWDGRVVAKDTFQAQGHSGTSMGWVRHGVSERAAGARSTVAFADATPDHSACGAAIDNVVLAAE